MSNDDAGDSAAKELISMVIANVRKGAPKTGKINNRPPAQKKTTASAVVVPTPEEVAEQLRKFENMVIIQRLDSLIDMQKMQWEKLDRVSSLLETLNLVVGEHQQPEELASSMAPLEELEELIKRQEASKTTADDAAYEQAELLARKIAKIKNEIN